MILTYDLKDRNAHINITMAKTGNQESKKKEVIWKLMSRLVRRMR